MKFNRNIFWTEVKLGRRSLTAWCLSIFLLILLGMSFYPILMKGDMLNQMSALFENPFMKNIMSAFGASLDVLTNVLGFYSTRSTTLILVLGGLFAVLRGGGILAKEENLQTAEFLLTRPVTRIEVAGTKSAVFLAELLIFNLAVFAAGFLSLELFKGRDGYRFDAFLILWCYSMLLMLMFGAAGIYLSLLRKRGRSSTGAAVGIVIGFFFLDAMSKVSPAVDKIGYLSPFKFVDSRVLRPEYGLVWWRIAYFLGLSLLFFFLSMMRYRKKDILT